MLCTFRSLSDPPPFMTIMQPALSHPLCLCAHAPERAGCSERPSKCPCAAFRCTSQSPTRSRPSLPRCLATCLVRPCRGVFAVCPGLWGTRLEWLLIRFPSFTNFVVRFPLSAGSEPGLFEVSRLGRGVGGGGWGWKLGFRGWAICNDYRPPLLCPGPTES
jgi:hypothetical protein